MFIYDGTILPSVPLLITMYHGLVDAKLDIDGLYHVRSSVFDLDILSLITPCRRCEDYFDFYDFEVPSIFGE